MTGREMTDVAEVLAHHAGFDREATSRGRLERAVLDACRRRGVSLPEYLEMLRAGGEEVRLLVEAVTVHETAFFRHPEQFDLIARHLLGALPQPVAIWSAACSNGQEAYSLAMVLEETGVEGVVVATDISSRAVARAARGVYATRELRGLSTQRRERFLQPHGGDWVVAPAIRARVTVLRHNLVSDPFPLPPQTCGLVLCRNVLIYLAPERAAAVLQRIHDGLADRGHLLIGASESLWHIGEIFTLHRNDDVFVYARGMNPMPAHRARRARRPAPEAPAAEPLPTAAALRAEAASAAAAGDFGAAQATYRQAAYLDPGDVLTQVELGLVLEAAGDALGARRAFRTASGILAGADRAAIEAQLDGYRADELQRMLILKLEAAA